MGPSYVSNLIIESKSRKFRNNYRFWYCLKIFIAFLRVFINISLDNEAKLTMKTIKLLNSLGDNTNIYKKIYKFDRQKLLIVKSVLKR